MSYQALYRKYRPASFDEVVGQKHIVQTLKNAVEKDRIAHAYLFCGPRGTGKTSIAKIFARTLNCTGEHKPCMECENCRESLNGSHPDIVEIDAASNNGVDDVRDLIERVGYAPLLGKYKVYIIDEVHMMTAAAFNALLKTIEEPPEHVIFIFATTEPNKVLATILSRCQRYDFSQVSEKDILHRLQDVCKSEQIEADEDALELISELANGGMRDALSILDQCVAYEPDHLTLEGVREIYGVVQTEELGKIIEQLNPEQASETIAFVEDIEARGFDLKRFTADLIGLLKDSLIYDLASGTSLLSERKKEVIKKSLSPVPSWKRIQMLNELMNVYNKLGYASNMLDYIETALLKSAFSVQSAPAVSDRQSHDQPHMAAGQILQKTENPIPAPVKPAKSPKVSKKSDLAMLFWNSDVSRETMGKEKNPKSEFRLEEDFLLSLLVGASKTIRSEDEGHMNDLPKYFEDVDWGKFANALKGSKIVASAETYMLVSAPHMLERDHINALQNEDGFEEFTNQWLGHPKKLFSLAENDRVTLLQTFVKRSKEKTLPEPAKIEVSLASSEPEESLEESLKARFPDLVVQDD